MDQSEARPYWPCRCCRSITWQLEAGEWICGACAFPAGELPTLAELVTLGPSPGRPRMACPTCGLGRGWTQVGDRWFCRHCGGAYHEPSFVPPRDDRDPDKTPRALFGDDPRGRVFTIATQAQEA